MSDGTSARRTTTVGDAGGIAFERIGVGEPLLLVHGTGLSRQAWEPVVGLLAERRELLLVDLPGHGASRAPPPEIPPTPIEYARALAAMLDEIELETIHIAGNSVGGWTALELAKMGRARSVIALAPAGLWPERDPLSAWGQLFTVFVATRLFRPVVPLALRSSLGRMFLMRGSIGDPRKTSPEGARRLALSFQEGAGVRDHLLAMRRIHGFQGGQSIEVPVTVAWGEKERIIPKSARCRDQLPPTTREVELPGCGHLMQWDEPELVARTILEGSTA
jgi:pimeloyl-ACP methyl ester carboxylesterase